MKEGHGINGRASEEMHGNAKKKTIFSLGGGGKQHFARRVLTWALLHDPRRLCDAPGRSLFRDRSYPKITNSRDAKQSGRARATILDVGRSDGEQKAQASVMSGTVDVWLLVWLRSPHESFA